MTKIWYLHAKLGLFWDQIWTLVPFGTKSQIWDFIRAPALSAMLWSIMVIWGMWSVLHPCKAQYWPNQICSCQYNICRGLLNNNIVHLATFSISTLENMIFLFLFLLSKLEIRISNFSFYSRNSRSESQISPSTLEIRDQNLKFLFLLSKFEIRISNFSFYSRNSRSEF